MLVVGQGYVGLPLAVRAVVAGYDVVGYDIDSERVDRLRAGTSFIEDVDDAGLAMALESGRFALTHEVDDIAGFDLAILTVPTPLRDGVPDLGHIEAAGRQLAPFLRPGCTVVLESTTYPGTTEEFLVPLLEAGSGGLRAGADFLVGYSPERIDPGNTVYRLDNTPKVVSGTTPEALDRIGAFYADLVSEVVPVASPRAAELSKLLENTFRHVNIALVNELAIFAAELDIDIWAAIDAADTKPFGFMRFTPGPGVGGHCLPIDPSFLSWRVQRSLGHRFRFVELANDVNDHMPDHVVQRITRLLNDRSRPVRGSTLLLLGYAYKPNTGDDRQTPVRPIAEKLAELGATVWCHDSWVDPANFCDSVEPVDLTASVVAAADVVVLLVDHCDLDLAIVVDHAAVVFDTRNAVTGPNVVKL